MEQAATPIMSIDEAFRLGYPIDQAMREGVRQALIVHHKLGQDVATWRDGKVAIVPAAEVLALFDDEEGKPETLPPKL